MRSPSRVGRGKVMDGWMTMGGGGVEGGIRLITQSLMDPPACHQRHHAPARHACSCGYAPVALPAAGKYVIENGRMEYHPRTEHVIIRYDEAAHGVGLILAASTPGGPRDAPGMPQGCP